MAGLLVAILVAFTLVPALVAHHRHTPQLIVGIVRWHLETGVGGNLDCWRLK